MEPVTFILIILPLHLRMIMSWLGTVTMLYGLVNYTVKWPPVCLSFWATTPRVSPTYMNFSGRVCGRTLDLIFCQVDGLPSGAVVVMILSACWLQRVYGSTKSWR